MKKIIIGLFVFGLTSQLFAQDPVEQLEEVVLVNTNYKYLRSTDADDLPIEVDQLQIKAANFDIKTLDIYQDEYDLYDVYFIIPDGRITATYDNDGNILRTAEKYKDLELPQPVLFSVAKRFPNWAITKDVYLVNYKESEKSKKMYKITLQNGEKRIKVKLDDKGNFL
ncbi:nicotinate-nucleotide adenylyltransferase [Lacinutrix neustonica]|uniref:Nicotinate-nucleotide adenylyltransferase n=1 Tax=Lacinutrix neustonica TaxID=2980107 RepID=A0A9E8SEJ3_9FLAO|nr:nicotinate-nucleotide adenylyltransferase [Lacinutrix neustonica]WAC02777.1 nicotinate-nucleotide adenylyltransferase [Lacinutrix neustonica]